MKEKLEAKKTQLLENKKIVEGQIQEGTRLLEKARADLNAILGAIQVVNQLLEEGDKDGTKEGFDLELIKLSSKLCNIPLIVCGGCGSLQDIIDLKKNKFNIDGIGLGTVLHYDKIKINDAKKV